MFSNQVSAVGLIVNGAIAMVFLPTFNQQNACQNTCGTDEESDCQPL